MSSWGSPGSSLNWRFDLNSKVGDVVDIVADVVGCNGDSGILCTLYPCGTRAVIVGGVPVPAQAQSLSIFHAKVQQVSPQLTFFVDQADNVLFHRRIFREDVRNVIELCVGLGIGTYGLTHAGIPTVAAVDSNPAFIEAFKELHPFIPTVVGDIGDPEVIKALHQAFPDPATMMCGFSCQPFSPGGSMQGADDDRASSLPRALRAAFMLRSVVIILECVQDAGTNLMVRNALNSCVSQCGYHLAEVVLRLEDVWVSRRCRWWAVLTAPFLGPVQLPAFEASEHPSVPRDLFGSPLIITQECLDQLVLGPAEFEKFLRYEPHLAKMFLQLDRKAPTALHSWGSQVVGCKCGCRTYGFSHDTLAARGIYGVLVPLPELGFAPDGILPLLRHLHPLEVALLNGVPELVWPDDLRLTLAGLGQMASPLQSAWVGAWVQRHVDCVFTGVSSVVPLDVLNSLKRQVMMHASMMDYMPVPPPEVPEPPVAELPIPLDDVGLAPWSQFQHAGGLDEVTVVLASDRVPFVVRLSDPEDTVAAVVVATCELLECADERFRVVDCASGLDLSFGHLAAGMCLWFTKDEVFEVDADAPALPEISATLPWEVDLSTPPDPCVPVSRIDDDVVESVHEVSVSRIEPLVNLSAERLLLVTEPSIPDVQMLQALRNQTIQSEARKQILTNQGTVWADDEMLFHMQQMKEASRAPHSNWAIMDPLLCAEAVKRPSSALISQWIQGLDFQPKAILAVVCVNQHWIPFMWTWTPHCTIASSWDVPGSPPRELSRLHHAVAMAVGSRTYTVHVVHRKFAVDQLCGICALRFIDSMLRGKMLPTNEDEARQLHAIGRSLFVAHLNAETSVPRPWIFAAGLDSRSSDRLHGLLTEHGVPSSLVASRASLLIQAIGLSATQKALLSGQPWRALKSAANQARPQFQLVLPDELEALVGMKAKNGGLKGKKKAQATKSPPNKPSAPASLDPAKLSLEEGSFTSQAGDPLRSLAIQEVGPFKSGVVLATLDSAFAFLKAGQLVSNGPLALLLLNTDESQLNTSLAWTFVRVILRCQANGEPILVPAFLVQLGQQLVMPRTVASSTEQLHEPAACVKFAVYKDSVEDWELVVRALSSTSSVKSLRCSYAVSSNVPAQNGTHLLMPLLKTRSWMFGVASGSLPTSRAQVRSMPTFSLSTSGTLNLSRTKSWPAPGGLEFLQNLAALMPRNLIWTFKFFGSPKLTRLSLQDYSSVLPVPLELPGSALGMV